MTSTINYNGVDQLFPVAGQDNDSQGFRDNFSTIKDALQDAYNEISDLQEKAILVAKLSPDTGVVTNDLQGSTLTSGSYKDFHTEIYTHDASDVIDLDVALGDFQLVTLTNNSNTITFSNWPTPSSTSNGLCAKVIVHMTVSNSRETATPTLDAGEGTLKFVGGFPSLTLRKDAESNPIPKVIEAWSPDEGVTVYVRYLGEFLNGTEPVPNSVFNGDVTLDGNDALLSVPLGEVSSFNLTSTGLANLANTTAEDLTVSNGTILNALRTNGDITAIGNIDVAGTFTATGNVNLGNASSGAGVDKVRMVGIPVLPSITTAQRNALPSEEGMLVFNSDVNALEICDETGTEWRTIDPNHSVEELTDGAAVSVLASASWFSTVAESDTTLGAGAFPGQVKRFAMNAYAGDMTITVAPAYRGWGGAGTITFSAAGQGCTLQYLNDKWFCVGNNGAVFA